MNQANILKSPIVTEKALGSNRYSFKVDLKARKEQIREAIQTQFGVSVKKINTSIRKGKKRVEKIAIVTLATGQTIPELEVKKS